MGGLATGIEEVLPAVLLIVMTGIVAGDVVLRYLFSQPQAWVHELALLLFVWQLFLGAAGAARRRLHIGVEFFASLLSGRMRALHLVLANLMMTTIVAISATLALRFALAARRDFQVLGVSYTWMYMAVPIGLGLFSLHATGDTLAALRALVTGNLAAEIPLADTGIRERPPSSGEQDS